MKKTYISPDLQVVMSEEAICESIIVGSGDSQNASGQQLVKEDAGAWDIWGSTAE